MRGGCLASCAGCESCPGLTLLGVATFVIVTRFEVLMTNHPGYPIALVLTFGLGLLMMSRARRSPSGVIARIGRGVATVLALLLAGALLWARPFPAADAAMSAVAGAPTVQVSESRAAIRFHPNVPTGSGLILYPGARVDPRAYAVLAGDIAAAGHPVVVVKCAFDIALLCGTPDVPNDRVWAVGGHSLGGVAAARQVEATDAAGLVFWASFPADDQSGLSIPVASISGTEDGLSTPADIANSAANLPPTAVFTAIEGANHAHFGDYGEQSGDGTATIDRSAAQAQIVAATIALLSAVDAQT